MPRKQPQQAPAPVGILEYNTLALAHSYEGHGSVSKFSLDGAYGGAERGQSIEIPKFSLAVTEGVAFQKAPALLIQEKLGHLPSKQVGSFSVYRFKASNYLDAVYIVDIFREQVMSFTTMGMTEAEITAKTERVIGKYHAHIASDITLDKLDTGRKPTIPLPAEKYPETFEGFLQWKKDQAKAEAEADQNKGPAR